MAKEGKSNFELKKGKRFQFDLSKNPKRIFDLVKDVDEAPDAVDSVPTPADTNVKASQSLAKPTIPETQVQMDPVAASPDKSKLQPKPKSKAETKEDAVKSSKEGTEQPVAPVGTETPEETGYEGGSNKWIWIIGATLVVAIIAWLCVRGCSSFNDNDTITEPTEETVEATGASEEEAVVEEPTTENKEDQQASPETETESPAAEEAAPADVPNSTYTPSGTAASASTVTQASSPTTATRETASRPSDNAVSDVSAPPSAEVSSDIEAEAVKVIRGDYGIGLERKLKLGSKYREIQNRVNELKRMGAF